MVTRRRRTARAGRTIRAVRPIPTRCAGARQAAGRARLFRERAEAVGAEVKTAAGPGAARRLIASILNEAGAATVAVAADAKPFLPAPSKLRPVRGNRPRDIAAAGVGIVFAPYGVAETGSLVHFDRSDAEKNVWTLPPVCVAVLEAHKIVDRLEDVLPALARHLSRPSGFGQASLVTGPSRTADVENVLQTGVHGPGRLVIVLLEERKRRSR